MTREQHLKAIYIVGSRNVGKRTVLVMLCSGPECGGAQILARLTAGDVIAEANAHVDKMADLVDGDASGRRSPVAAVRESIARVKDVNHFEVADGGTD